MKFRLKGAYHPVIIDPVLARSHKIGVCTHDLNSKDETFRLAG